METSTKTNSSSSIDADGFGDSYQHPAGFTVNTEEIKSSDTLRLKAAGDITASEYYYQVVRLQMV